MTKNLLKFFCLLFLLGGLTSTVWAQFKVVGYQPYWAGSAGSIQYSKLTHINYSFALPQSDGHLKPLNNPSFLQQIVSNAHAVGTKVYIAIGGWSDNGTIIDPTFETLASSAAGRTNFVNDAMSLVNTYNLDGVDIDWEFPDAGSSANNFTALMQQLYNALNPAGKGLSCAVSASSYYGNNIQSAVFGYISHLNVMAYDNDQEANHSSYAYAQSSINLYVGRGCPKNKVILGVPFYGRPSWNSYATLLSQGASPNSDQFGSDYYNGIPTIQSKTQLAWNTAGGIMIWELSQDATGANSLLSAIYNKKVSLGGTSNQNPTVSLTSPSNGASFNAPASVTISANASDPDGSISKVEFYNGGTLLNSDNSAPYSYSWTNVAAGSYSITAKAYDNSTGTATTSAVTITVNSASNQAPTVTITSPSSGTTFTAPATISISANASDADGSISKVEFYQGSTFLGSDNTSPYTFSVSNVAAGSYSLTAKAFDNSGATATSSSVSITVNSTTGGNCTYPSWNAATAYNGGALVSYNNRSYKARWWTQNEQPDLNTASGKPWEDLGACGGSPSNQNPTISLTAPSSGSTYTAPASITISANASDADGSISKVEFYNGSTLLNSDNTAPYSYVWTNVAAGSYSITAKAYDNSTGTGTTTAISVTVNGSVSNQVPSVSLTSPSSGASFNAPATVTISANASDADGSISKVEFYQGSNLLNSDNAAPYTYSWTNVAAGVYNITAKAYDNSGATTTTSSVSITVNASTGGCSGVPQYVQNGGYTDGSIVKNGNNRYQCKPWPYSGWCNGAAAAYAPGSGTNWTDAWTLVGGCNAKMSALSGDINSNEGLSPNPAYNVSSLKVSVNAIMATNETLMVITSSGYISKSQPIILSEGLNELSVDISGLTEGIYLVKIGEKHFRFVVSK